MKCHYSRLHEVDPNGSTANDCPHESVFDCSCGVSVCDEHLTQCDFCHVFLCVGCANVFERMDRGEERSYTLCPRCYKET